MLTLALLSALQAPVDPAALQRFGDLALACLDREYPNKLAHVLSSAADVRAPRELTPAFFGCYDWHSAVHGHWLLLRLLRLGPDAPAAARLRAALSQHLTPERIAGEAAYLQGAGRSSFERPYGLAWLLQLALEAAEWPDPDARRWAAALRPLEAVAVARLTAWLPKLSHPVRSGEHSQTAFALGLLLDYARGRGDGAFRRLLEERARAYYLQDRACPLAYEPSGEDFLSPCLAEADVVRRVLPPARFAAWLTGFLPDDALARLRPLRVTDPEDGKLVHLDGLNLSRAWMLQGVAAGLPPDHRLRPRLVELAAAHQRAGLLAVSGARYEGGHWLGSFAVYLLSRRGLGGP